MSALNPDLTGRAALVTGTTSGLGRRFAKLLAAHGAKVALTGRRVDRLEEVAAEIRADGGTCAYFPLDMMDADNIKQVVADAEKELGLIDILINNAGVPDAQRAHKMSVDLIDTVLGTNLRGPYILSTEVARRLIEEKKPGRMINISSIAGFHYDGHGAALYSISKAGIARMSEALGVEWARFNINVNGIAPGFFYSEMTDGMVERMGDITQVFPRKRGCAPEQMDSTVLYLVSPASECVTGTVIKVDDGQSPR
ncbi:MAG: SDR family NAD(P)-dependent oxidoreductase [Alphaproteobacteria bacterium]